jgi:hypothetical protein
VAFNAITKNAPVLNGLALWANNDGTSFYQWPSGFLPASNALYASGNGSGYLFGGYVSLRTGCSIADLWEMPSIPGLVSCDMAADTWTNDTSCIDGSCYRVIGYLDFVPASALMAYLSP